MSIYKNGIIDNTMMNINIKEKEGISISIDDSEGQRIFDTELIGNTSQGSNPTPDDPQDIHNVSGDNIIKIIGKNLLKCYSSSSSNTLNGITRQWDSSTQILTLNGTCDTNNTVFQFVSPVLKTGYYSLSYEVISGSITPAGNLNCIQILRTSDWEGISLTLTNNSNKRENKSISTSTYNYSGIRIDNGTVCNNFKIRIQLELNPTATGWEPHQEKQYKISLPVENLFNPFIYNTTATHSSCVAAITNTSINVTPTGNSYLGSALKYPQYVNDNNKPTCIEVKPNTTYTFSINNTGNSYITYVDSNYQAINTVDYPLDNLTKYTFTTPSNCKYVMFRLGKNSGTTSYSFENIQLEKGTKANTYTPHGLVPVGENLFDEDNMNIVASAFIPENVTTGTITASGAGLKILYIPIEGGKTYTINKGIGKVFRVATSINTPAVGVTLAQCYSRSNNVDTSDTYTITTNSDANYLLVNYIRGTSPAEDHTEREIVDTIDIKEGNIHAIELNKIWYHKDKIIRDNNGDWYWEKNIGTDKLDENSGWSIMTVSTDKKMFKCKDSNYITGIGFSKILVGNNDYSGYYISNYGMTGYQTLDNGGIGVTVAYGYRGNSTSVDANEGATVDQWKGLVANNNIIIKGVLATPQYLKITYQPLIDQLNAIENDNLFKGANHIIIEPNDLTPTLKFSYSANINTNKTQVYQDKIITNDFIEY